MASNSWWGVLKGAFQGFSDDKVTRLAAALSYYTAVSIAPMLVFLLLLLGTLWDPKTAESDLNAQLQQVFGEQGMQFIHTIMDNASTPNAGSIAGIFSLLALLWGSTNVFMQIQDALNTIWGVEAAEGGIKATLWKRLVTFTMVLGIGFLLMVSLVLSSALSILSSQLSGWLPGFEWVWQVVEYAVSLAIFALLFAAIYKVLPDVKLRWSDVWIGAVAAAVLFTIGKVVLTIYLGRGATSSTYGAASSVIVFLLWVYFSSIILFVGAEIAESYSSRRGSRAIAEKPTTVP